jgi:hypothetical protein
MARFVLILNSTGRYGTMTPDEQQSMTHAFMTWTREMRQVGKVVGGEKLQDGGRILEPKAGMVAEAPFTETRETIGGFFVVEAPSLDEACEIAKTNPTFGYGGQIEVRPIDEMPRS